MGTDVIQSQTAADVTRKPGMQGIADLSAPEGGWCETKGGGESRLRE